MHDETVTSHGFREARPLSLDLLKEWMCSTLLPEAGPRLYRMKGVIHVAGSDTKFVYQARATGRRRGGTQEP